MKRKFNGKNIVNKLLIKKDENSVHLIFFKLCK